MILKTKIYFKSILVLYGRKWIHYFALKYDPSVLGISFMEGSPGISQQVP